MSQMKAPEVLARSAGREKNTVHADYAKLSRHTKAWLTAQAECLLAGFKADLIDGDDGRPLLVVSRWPFTRTFTTSHDAINWLRRLAQRGRHGAGA